MALRAHSRLCPLICSSPLNIITSTTTTTVTLPSPPTRHLHNHVPLRPIPPPTPFVPDPTTFLSLIGRSLSQHAPKFPTWTSLFSLTGPQMRELGIEPARDRRYLLRWREKFRNGEYGIGGDLKAVGSDGAAVVKVVDVEVEKGRVRRRVVNVGAAEAEEEGEAKGGPRGLRVREGGMVVGRGVRHAKGGRGRVGLLKPEEGLWEVRRGHKVDGGERRKAEVRAKRMGEERSKR